MSEREEKLYKDFDYLDLLILLNVRPEESIARKPDHAFETIQYKHEALSRLIGDLNSGREKYNWVSIDANTDVDQVFLEIKRAVWAVL